MADLFDRRHNALWRAGISGDAAAEFIAFWRKMDHDFTDAEWGTRFLGDLYQDLSEYAKKTFALLQTPEFIEEFILDRTLDPAIDRFGYEQVRMIDPTCGSGHFVLGGFKRLLTHWQKGHPEMNEREIVKNALAGVAGVDLNPFAVAIARFRLLLEAWRALCRNAPSNLHRTFHVNLAVGDSLLHGPVPGELTSPEALKLRIESSNNTYSTELPDELARILGQRYHAVVGNPPYITVKDKALSDAYRNMLWFVPPPVFALRALHGALLRPRGQRRRHPAAAGRIRRADYGEFLHEARVWQEAHRGIPPALGSHARPRHLGCLHSRPRHAHGHSFWKKSAPREPHHSHSAGHRRRTGDQPAE
jgi:hypothetical protein